MKGLGLVRYGHFFQIPVFYIAQFLDNIYKEKSRKQIKQIVLAKIEFITEQNRNKEIYMRVSLESDQDGLFRYYHVKKREFNKDKEEYIRAYLQPRIDQMEC